MDVLSRPTSSYFPLIYSLGLCALIAGCGTRSNMEGQNGQSSAQQRGVADVDDQKTADANSANAKPKLPKKPPKLAENPAPPKLVECGNLPMHEGQTQCDSDDVLAHQAQQLPPDLASEPPPATPVEAAPLPPVDKELADSPAPTLDPAANGDANVVVFRIKSGTGSGSWNTEAEMIPLKVGQVLRVVNEDTIIHRLHTNGAPCPHGQNVAPGASFDCNVARAFDPKGRGGPLYDHIAGTRAQFWIKAEP